MNKLAKNKKVLVYSGTNRQGVVIETSATTWGELKREMGNKYQYKKLKFIVGETRNTLESDNALLPKNDFTLFALVKKTKSGADYENMSYRELRTEIKNIIKNDPEMKDYFRDGKKNWTQLSIAKMISLLKGIADKKKEEEVTKEEVKVKEEDSYASYIDGLSIEDKIKMSITILNKVLEDFNTLKGYDVSNLNNVYNDLLKEIL